MLEFLQKNILLVAAAVGSGAMLLWPMLRGAGGASVNTLQATQLMNRENALVLDVRDAASYASGHILGARNVPLADLEKRIGELDKFKAKPVIVMCEVGNSSARAVRCSSRRASRRRSTSLGLPRLAAGRPAGGEVGWRTCSCTPPRPAPTAAPRSGFWRRRA
jgi:hypothetical protein